MKVQVPKQRVPTQIHDDTLPESIDNHLDALDLDIHYSIPAPPNCPLRNPKYHQIETIRLLIEVHWGV